jgi:hypothetical protein
MAHDFRWGLRPITIKAGTKFLIAPWREKSRGTRFRAGWRPLSEQVPSPPGMRLGGRI